MMPDFRGQPPGGPATRWRLRYDDEPGFLFESVSGRPVPAGEKTVGVVPGDVVVIATDVANLPLSDEELKLTRVAMHKLLEEGILQRLYREEMDGRDLVQPIVWDIVAQQLFRHEEPTSAAADGAAGVPGPIFERVVSPSKLKGLYRSCRSAGKRHNNWKDWMRAEAFQDPTSCVFSTQIDLSFAPVARDLDASSLLPTLERGGPLRVEVYYRALDRCPGGNRDTFTLRYSIRIEDDEVKSVAFDHHSNWDGSHSAGSGLLEDVRIALVAGDFARRLITALKDVAQAADEGNKWSEGGRGFLEWNVVDEKTTDMEEYDTEWSSVEILVFARPHFDVPFSSAQFASLSPELRARVHTALRALSHEPGASGFDDSQVSGLPPEIANTVVREVVNSADVPERCMLRPGRRNGPTAPS
jgi:hypothetical protein